jgi:hypothetical protein
MYFHPSRFLNSSPRFAQGQEGQKGSRWWKRSELRITDYQFKEHLRAKNWTAFKSPNLTLCPVRQNRLLQFEGENDRLPQIERTRIETSNKPFKSRFSKPQDPEPTVTNESSDKCGSNQFCRSLLPHFTYLRSLHIPFHIANVPGQTFFSSHSPVCFPKT